MHADPARAYTGRWCPAGRVEYLTRADGSRLRYLVVGAGPPLVLMHTVRTQLDYFQRVIPSLVDRYTVYAFDYPGFGWSDIRPGVSYEEPAMRRALVEFVEQLDLTDVTLVGESMGATLALTGSTELESRVRRVVAFNPYDYPQGLARGNLLSALIVGFARLPVVGLVPTYLENTLILTGIMRGGFYDPTELPRDFVAELRRSGRRPGYGRVTYNVFRSLPSYIAARARYPHVTAPVTLVYGDHDWSRPSERQEVARALGGIPLTTLPNVGHFSALEQPATITRFVLTEMAASGT
jgi:pimeloyl-ACP methyl ester carboxylesterase